MLNACFKRLFSVLAFSKLLKLIYAKITLGIDAVNSCYLSKYSALCDSSLQQVTRAKRA